MGAADAYPLKRFGLKLVFLVAFGLMQWRSTGLRIFVLAFLISGNLSTWLAMFRRTPLFRERRFTYWDEAAAFFAMSALAALAANP